MGHHDHDSSSTPAATTTTAVAAAASSTTSSATGFDSTICPALPNPINDADPIAGNLSFHTLSEYLCLAFAAVATVIAGLLILRHALRLTRPSEQIRIMRLTALIPTFAILSVGTVYLGTGGIYLLPWLDFFESISLVNFFFLIQSYLLDSSHDESQAPHKSMRNEGFEATEQYRSTTMEAAMKPPPAVSVHLMTLQYVAVTLFVGVLTCITQAVERYCLNSNSIHFAHLWLELIRTVSVSAAVLAVLRFTQRNKPHIVQHKPMIKLIAFKLIVFLQLVQNLIFSYAGNHITPTTKFSYVDLTVGLPSLITCAEMLLFAVVFHFVYGVSPYQNGGYRGSAAGAIFKAFNPVSVVMDMIRGC